MTKEEFLTIKPGYPVRLEFSTNKDQIVESVNVYDGTIASYVNGDRTVKYVNHYNDVTYVNDPAYVKKLEANLKEKDEILNKFSEFVKNGCDNCPFKVECDNTYNYVRSVSTSSITICNALRMKEERDY